MTTSNTVNAEKTRIILDELQIDMPAAAKRMREALDRSGLSQSEVERRMGVSKGYLVKVLGARSDPTMTNLNAFAKIVGESVDWFLTGLKPKFTYVLGPADAASPSPEEMLKRLESGIGPASWLAPDDIPDELQEVLMEPFPRGRRGTPEIVIQQAMMHYRSDGARRTEAEWIAVLDELTTSYRRHSKLAPRTVRGDPTDKPKPRTKKKA